MTVKLARHRAAAPAAGPAVRPNPRTSPRTSPHEATHRGGLPPAVSTTLLSAAVLAALTVVVLGVLR